MSDATEFFKGEYLVAEDMKADQPLNLTITKVEQTEFEGKPKLVLHFNEIEKVFGLNKTNAFRIIEYYGKETNEWPGKTITLIKSTTEMGGKDVPCIRVLRKEVEK